MMEELTERLMTAQTASCTCGTKTFESKFHTLDCRYRVLIDAEAEIESLQHDVTRHLAISSEQADHITRLEAELAAARNTGQLLRALLKEKRVCDDEIDSVLDPSVDRRSVWFMYDCHAFAKPDMTSKETARASIRELFNNDSCGSVFVRKWPDGPHIRELDLSPASRDNNYTVSDAAIDEWLDKYFAARQAEAQGEGNADQA
jgi:hypothetical protein